MTRKIKMSETEYTELVGALERHGEIQLLEVVRPSKKKCGNCFKVKPISEFYKNRSKPDVVQWRCKACNAEVCRAYEERKRERDRLNRSKLRRGERCLDD